MSSGHIVTSAGPRLGRGARVPAAACSRAWGLGSGFSVGIPGSLSIPSLEALTSSGGSALGPAHGLARRPGPWPGTLAAGNGSARCSEFCTEAPSEIKDVQSDAVGPGCEMWVLTITVCSLRKGSAWAPTDSSPMSRPPSMHLPSEGACYERPTPHPTSRRRRRPPPTGRYGSATR